MKREIKYRAKVKNTNSYNDNRWVIGYYLGVSYITGETFNGFLETYGNKIDKDLIVTDEGVAFEIIPETLCQVSQRLDSDKIFLIFENDIVEDGNGKQYVVKYWEDALKLQQYYGNGEFGDYYCNLGEFIGELEIVGNIIDDSR